VHEAASRRESGFPDIGSQAFEYPVVQFAYEGGTHSDSEVLRPAAYVLIEFVYYLPDASPAFSGGQRAHGDGEAGRSSLNYSPTRLTCPVTHGGSAPYGATTDDTDGTDVLVS